MKQIVRVYEAYLAGCRTTRELSEVTGLSLKHCSALTRELELCGMVHKTGVTAGYKGPGQRPYFYEPSGQDRVLEARAALSDSSVVEARRTNQKESASDGLPGRDR